MRGMWAVELEDIGYVWLIFMDVYPRICRVLRTPVVGISALCVCAVPEDPEVMECV